jgi:metal-responsive CopG/Arc/MetJ family transcriptional regulator
MYPHLLYCILYDKTIKIRTDSKMLEMLDELVVGSSSRSRVLRNLVLKEYKNLQYQKWLNSLPPSPEWT